VKLLRPPLPHLRPPPHPPDERASAVRPPVASDSSKPERPSPHPITFLSGPIRCLPDSARLPPFSLPRPTTVRPPPDPRATFLRAHRRRSIDRRSSRYGASSSPSQLRCSLLTCWNLLSAARRPTRVNGGDNRVTCSGAIALLI
jgi:hypothetical protein